MSCCATSTGRWSPTRTGARTWQVRFPQGALDGGVLTCGAHEWQFDARTGRGVNPASACLRRYPVRLDGEQIFVRL